MRLWLHPDIKIQPTISNFNISAWMNAIYFHKCTCIILFKLRIAVVEIYYNNKLFTRALPSGSKIICLLYQQQLRLVKYIGLIFVHCFIHCRTETLEPKETKTMALSSINTPCYLQTDFEDCFSDPSGINSVLNLDRQTYTLVIQYVNCSNIFWCRNSSES